MKRWPFIVVATCLSLGVLGLSVSDAKPPVAQKKVEKAPVDPKAEAAFREAAKKLASGTELDKVLALENQAGIDFIRQYHHVAIADGAFEISAMKDSAGKLLPARSGLSTVVAVRKGDRWYVTALRGMVPSVPAGAPGK